ncbi:hypothetical protein [Parvularcula lutaonensis]|uniref:Co-chaperone DjlA N-terminal domain-containing protein n=1 Tax=Parvularcula lutaonensis TaxID=491923 RepID=A0ABV7M790_9PROT|nr:hypothetical protein [Parvularcula lutaonensis]GGY41156.1 hypothetical protein GCM10007148_07170 [Parvularcula lutaonensis]
MHILGLLITVLIGISVWWWRLRMLKEASDTVIDAADRFRGAQRRKEIASRTEMSPITAIDHPVTAAATYIHMVIGREDWPMASGRVKMQLAEVSSESEADDAITYAEWAVRQPIDQQMALRLLTEMLRDWLTLEEREDLAEMLRSAAESSDAVVQSEASRQAIALIN